MPLSQRWLAEQCQAKEKPVTPLRLLPVFVLGNNSGMLRVEAVSQTNNNRRMFRTVARASTGDTFEPGQSEIIFFGRLDKDVVAVSCYEPADPTITNATPSTDINTQYSHCISYIFVKPVSQGHGFGGQLVHAMEADMKSRLAGILCLRGQSSRTFDTFQIHSTLLVVY